MCEFLQLSFLIGERWPKEPEEICFNSFYRCQKDYATILYQIKCCSQKLLITNGSVFNLYTLITMF